MTDCRSIAASDTFDCANPWGGNCTSGDHFQFTSLWNFTQQILQSCANDTRLFEIEGGLPSAQNVSLNHAGCVAIAGASWTPYPGADIWVRLTTWKFPLLQLVGLFPRPPLSFSAECFVITHLLGDPIDTIWHLIHKLDLCQSRAEYWREEYRTVFTTLQGDKPDRQWKALTLIEDAYGEWNESNRARTNLKGFL